MFLEYGELAAWVADIEKLMAGELAGLKPEWTPLKVWVGTWNTANMDPPYTQLPMREWLLGGALQPECDLYAVGFQELGSGGIGVGGAGGGGGLASAASANHGSGKRCVGGGGGGRETDRATDTTAAA